MKKENQMIAGAKYFIKDNLLDYVLSAQILSINNEEITFKDLDNDKEFYRDITMVEVISIISEEEAIRLNNQEIFSIQNDLIKAILGREEIVKHSADDFLKLKKDENTVLISITDPDKKTLPVEILSQFKNSLSLQFWDVEEPIGRFTPIEQSQAKEIKEFILSHKDDNFIIHCEAGISRSAAVGLAVYLFVKHNGDKYELATSYNPIKEHHRYHPNYTVLDVIAES